MDSIFVNLFQNPIIIFLISLFVLFCVFLIIKFIRSFGFEGELLFDHLSDSILPNSYFVVELERCGIDLAHKMMKYHHGSDFEPYRRKMLKKIKPLIFVQSSNPNQNWIQFEFSDLFKDFVNEYFETSVVKDFYKVVSSYLQYMYRDVPVVVHKNTEFEQSLTESLVSEMRLAEDMYHSEVESALESKRLEADDNSLENVKKRIITAYNFTIQEIKSHNNRGLNPVKIDILNDRFMVKLLSYKVFTQQKLFDMTSEQAMDFNCQGCYIIYNTFTKKYFIGQSDTMYNRVHTLLTSSSVKACASLQSDINAGHMILVKFVRFEDTGYTNINALHRDLILAYDCRQEKGYNK